MFKYAAAALLAGTTLIAAAPASAQDRAPFTGPRVEALVGYDKLQSGNEDLGDESIDGVAYGVGVGFDFDAGGVVLGVEGEYLRSEAGQDFDITNFDGRVETGRDLYVGVRVGVPVTPRTLIYAKGGYTNQTIESSFTTPAIDVDSSMNGWRIGGGIEQMLGRNLYLKAEYRYSNYDGLSFDDDVFGPDDIDIDVDRHQVMAGVGFRF